MRARRCAALVVAQETHAWVLRQADALAARGPCVARRSVKATFRRSEVEALSTLPADEKCINALHIETKRRFGVLVTSCASLASSAGALSTVA